MLEYLNQYEYLPILFIVISVLCLILTIYLIINLLRSMKTGRALKDNPVCYIENREVAEFETQEHDNEDLNFHPVLETSETGYQIGFIKDSQGMFKYVLKDMKNNQLGESRAYKTMWSCFHALSNVKNLLYKIIIENTETDLKFGKSAVLLKADNSGRYQFVIMNLMNEFFQSIFFPDKEACMEMLNKLRDYDFTPAIHKAFSYILPKPDEIDYQINLKMNSEGLYNYVIKDKTDNQIGISRSYKNAWSCFKALINIKNLLSYNIIDNIETGIKFGRSFIVIKPDDSGHNKFVIMKSMKEFFESGYFIDKEKCLETLNKLRGYDFTQAIDKALRHIL